MFHAIVQLNVSAYFFGPSFMQRTNDDESGLCGRFISYLRERRRSDLRTEYIE